MDGDLESNDHLSIDERTIDTGSKKFWWLIVNRPLIDQWFDETIIGYMEDEEHNDQDTCAMIIWWFRNYHNYLLGGVKFMFSSLLVCRSVSLSLSFPLSGSLPLFLPPFALSLSLSLSRSLSTWETRNEEYVCLLGASHYRKSIHYHIFP